MIIDLLSNNFGIYSLGFFFMNQFMSCYQEKKLAGNIVSFTHAFGSTLLNGLFLTNPSSNMLILAKNFSIGYFTFDALKIINKLKFSKMDMVFIYHHFATIYFLNLTLPYYYVQKILFLSEISNLPYYFVYHYLHITPKSMKNINFWKNIQFYVYSLIRIPMLSYIFYNAYHETNDIFSAVICLPVYLMGIFWSIILLKS